jgi:hypothetical protein
MAKIKDPRLPKKNSRLNYVDQLMRFSWSTYRQTMEYAVKRESITNLRARIDEWMAEPELVYDLAEGAADQVKRECWAKSSPADATFPFDASGDADDSYFFFATGTFSELFTADQMKLDDVKACIMSRTPYFVLQLEKIHVTENSTTMHFSSGTAFERHAQSASAKNIKQNRYVVLSDSAGLRKGYAMVACSSASLPQAQKRALELAEKFDIRFLVAQVDCVINVH